MGDSYRLPEDFALKLLRLKKDYLDTTKVDLDTAPQPYAISTIFGAKDVKTRWEQCLMFEQWIYGLNLHLPVPESIQHPGQSTPKPEPETLDEATWNTHCRVLIAFYLYIVSKIGQYLLSSPAMDILIKAAMNINPANPLDDATRAACLRTASLYLSNGAALLAINKNLHALRVKKVLDDGTEVTHQVPAMREETFLKLQQYVQDECRALDESFSARNYPITNLMIPALSMPLKIAGGSAGVLLGHIAANSTKAMSLHSTMAAGITSIALVAVPSAGKGLMLVAAPYATITAGAMFGITGYQGCSKIGEIAGKGMGFVIGLPCDTGVKMVRHLFHMAQLEYYYRQHGKKPVPGYSLLDGSFVAADYFKPMPDSAAPDILSASVSSSSSLPLPALEGFESAVEIDETSQSLRFHIAGETTLVPYDAIMSLDSEQALPYLAELREVLAEKPLYCGEESLFESRESSAESSSSTDACRM
ncbi:substrate of the Dot/Icm secretion system [Legionella geestiana]|uniref:Substrate of the Dot/Icm secretion system n=1 Tax=Legionella geestiana TaxID=45065 RepID=A0A0W0TSC0_9GAMM|nr:hypothetical protein [Legionella geestiana]KTC98331.1 substrate of the Dot/Icm secretion system [Legionella geestiana]QBS11377.1 hypothetical protein E4T54_00715 [Legionella geestiana]STX53968.1 Dot/Icm secretion system substrate [Legionella geestiana]